VKTRESDFDTQQKKEIFLDSVQITPSPNDTERGGVGGWGKKLSTAVAPVGV